MDTGPANRLDAVGMARQRCWCRDWVLDLDIKAFFDSIEPELLMRCASTPIARGRFYTSTDG